MLAAINTKVLIAIIAALAIIGAALLRIEANTRRQVQLTQQPIDENRRFAAEVEALKHKRQQQQRH